MDGGKVQEAVEAAAGAGAPEEKEEEEQAPRGGEPVRDGDPARGSRPRVKGKSPPQQEPAFVRAAAPRSLTGRAFPAPV
jgi:hypothetical protein